MSLYVSTNSAAVKANFHLGRNSSNLKRVWPAFPAATGLLNQQMMRWIGISMKLKARSTAWPERREYSKWCFLPRSAGRGIEIGGYDRGSYE